MLKSRLVKSRSFSSSEVIATRFPLRYLTKSPFLMDRLAVVDASCVIIVYRLVVDTSKGQSGSQILIYFRMWRLKSSFSRSVFNFSMNLRRPASLSRETSAF